MIQQIKQPVFLCGMMGAGKSTVGRVLAEKLSVPFYDLDQMIEKEEGRSIPEIFEHQGEEQFRKIERKLLISLTDDFEGVLALGGGALQNQHIVDHVKINGWLVYLDAPLETLLSRLEDTSGRPMISEQDTDEVKNRIELLLEKRGPLYNQAHITVKTATLPPGEIADLIIKKLSFYEQ